jgi:hypothetical protein
VSQTHFGDDRHIRHLSYSDYVGLANSPSLKLGPELFCPDSLLSVPLRLPFLLLLSRLACADGCWWPQQSRRQCSSKKRFEMTLSKGSGAAEDILVLKNSLGSAMVLIYFGLMDPGVGPLVQSS